MQLLVGNPSLYLIAFAGLELEEGSDGLSTLGHAPTTALACSAVAHGLGRRGFARFETNCAVCAAPSMICFLSAPLLISSASMLCLVGSCAVGQCVVSG